MIRFYVGILFLALFACNSKSIYTKSITFENQSWSQDQNLGFDFNIADSEQQYNLFFDIDHSTDYPYENLYLRINTTFPDASTASDTLSIEMTGQQGQWMGKCSSEKCKLRVFLQQKVRFKDSGAHVISFEQFTRDDDLMGIDQVSFSIEKSF